MRCGASLVKTITPDKNFVYRWFLHNLEIVRFDSGVPVVRTDGWMGGRGSGRTDGRLRSYQNFSDGYITIMFLAMGLRSRALWSFAGKNYNTR